MSASSNLMSQFKTMPVSQMNQASQPQAPQPSQTPAPQQSGGLMSQFNTMAPTEMASNAPPQIQPIGGGAQSAPSMGIGRRVLERLAQLSQPINNVGDAVTRGIIQGTAASAQSLVNFLPDVLNSAAGFSEGQGVRRVPSPTWDGQPLERSISSDPISQLAFKVGDLGARTLIANKVYEGAGKIPGFRSSSLLPTIGRGVGTGAALGQDAPGGRTGGAILGGIAAPLMELAPKRIMETVSNASKEAQALYTQKYNDWFGKVKDAGIDTIRPPTFIDFDAIKAIPSSSKYMQSVNRFYENPTFENAQSAQSDLGALKREVEGTAKSARRGYSSSEESAIKAIGDARDKIRGAGMQALSKAGRGDLADEYKAIQAGYRDEVVPYFKKPLQEYQYGKVTASNAAKRLSKDKYFQKFAEENHPELMRYSEYGPKVKQAAGMLGGGYLFGLGGKLGLIGNKDLNFNDNSSGSNQ